MDNKDVFDLIWFDYAFWFFFKARDQHNSFMSALETAQLIKTKEK